MEVNHLYEGKSLTLLKGVLQHFFIYTKIFYEEVEIARSELGDVFYLLCCFFISSTTSCSDFSSSWRLFPNILTKYNQGNLFYFLWNNEDYCLFPLEKDPGGEGAKVVPSTKQLYEGDQSGWSTPKKNNVSNGKFMESRDIKYLGTLL